jgi:hypothetical protein
MYSLSLGRQVAELIEGRPHLSLLDPTKALDRQSRADQVFVIGASGAGKTSLIRAARARFAADDDREAGFPRRLSTREPREDDDPQEDEFVPEGAFRGLVRSGALGFHWTKRLSDGSAQCYGFRPQPPRFVVYSGNDALIGPTGAFEALPPATLLVELWADAADRSGRIRSRSPELLGRLAEMRTRLQSIDHDAERWPRVRVLNSNRAGSEPLREAADLLVAVAERKE